MQAAAYPSACLYVGGQYDQPKDTDESKPHSGGATGFLAAVNSKDFMFTTPFLCRDFIGANRSPKVLFTGESLEGINVCDHDVSRGLSF